MIGRQHQTATRGDNTTGQPLRVVLADDHAAVLRAIERILLEDGFIVAGAVGTGTEALAIMAAEEPDLAVLDLAMPGGGLAMLEAAHRASPGTAVVVLTALEQEDWAIPCIAAGAVGFVTKDEPLAELRIGLQRAARGGRYVSARVTDMLVDRARAGEACSTTPHACLSAQQLSVFHHLVAGHTLVAIGSAMDLSPKTVATYRNRVFAKLDAHCVADLVRYAREHNLLVGLADAPIGAPA